MLTLEAYSHNGIIDYVQLMSCLQGLRAPHRKINVLLKQGELLRIKKGLYVIKQQAAAVNLGVLANLIYGPSYVSQEYALQYYSFIPERVETITSMSAKRHKLFMTPLGRFSYTYINSKRFSMGIDWVHIGNDLHFLMASPEKALADTLAQAPHLESKSVLEAHLLENMRIDNASLKTLSIARLEKIARAYRHKNVTLLFDYLKG